MFNILGLIIANFLYLILKTDEPKTSKQLNLASSTTVGESWDNN